MNSMLASMVRRYEPKTLDDQRNAHREISQETILCGLSRADFFKRITTGLEAAD